jgi:DnaJ-class molecular chaperone
MTSTVGSTQKQDLYDILGVSKNATDDEIKKAYKKQALKYHPDRNLNNKEESNTKFQQINKAFQTLNNPEKRNIYDQFGVIDGETNEGIPGGMASGFNPFDIFGNMFGSRMSSNLNNPESRRNTKSPDKKITINISLKDVYIGNTVQIDFNKIICCNECEGCGAKSKDNIKPCNSCNGKGKIVRMMQMGPMIQQSMQICSKCNGNGKMISQGMQCTKCNGTKGISIKRNLDCYIRPGTTAGSHITFKNEADWHSDFDDVGDLIVYINSKHEEGLFHREADNLIMKKSITLLEALTKTEFMFKHLDERVIKVSHEGIIKPNQKMLIKGEGIPNINNNLEKGDLIIYFDVLFPNTLDKERAKYLVKILPIPKKQIWDVQLEKTPENDITNHILQNCKNDMEYNTNDYNKKTSNNNQTHSNISDEENDVFTQFTKGTMPNMTTPVECATQ